MTDDTERLDKLRRINEALRQWQQGDCTLGEQWFAYRIDPICPLTEAAQEAAEQGADLVESEVRGFVVLTQTCDIVRDYTDRPYVEVAPLVEVKEDQIHDIKRARRPQYAYIPGLSVRYLVADLDRVMTIEKSVITGWQRIPGCRDDDERRRLAEALERKRVRFAFPDDFTALAAKLQNRIKGKHDKSSIEGEALRALREIRVAASPSWNADKVELTFYFIRDLDQTDFKGIAWYDLQNKWLALVPVSERFESVDGSVVTYDDLTARDYVESDPLDLDHLSLSATSDS